MEALEMMRDEDAGPVPVISGGQLRGLLSRPSIMEYLQVLLDLQRVHSHSRKHFQA
jgi:CBS domain-containing protein